MAPTTRKQEKTKSKCPKPKFQYSDDQMKAALQDVGQGTTVSEAAKKHSVPRVTLMYKVKGISPVSRRMGPSTVLTSEEEEVLVLWISSVARAGFPITKTQLLMSVRQLIKKLDRPNPFSNNLPGKSWYKGFRNRHPETATRISENLTVSRANVTNASLKAWYDEVSRYMNEEGIADVLEEPARLFNADETAFLLNPKGNLVLSNKQDKNVYQVFNTDDEDCLTVLITGNAEGQLAPPLIVFQYQRIPFHITQSIPSGWGVGKSDSGWTTGVVFYEYLANIFYPWLVRQGIRFPVILFIDGHTAHLTLETSQFCVEKRIILVALHPNATHFIQPMDISVFKSLKQNWQEKVHEWRFHNNDRILGKADFALLLKSVLEELSPEILQNGFKKCGLFPWKPQEVIEQQESSVNINVSQMFSQNFEHREVENGLRVLERFIPPETLAEFKQLSMWEVKEQDSSLFKVWKEMKMQLMSHEGQQDVEEPSLSHLGLFENMQRTPTNDQHSPENFQQPLENDEQHPENYEQSQSRFEPQPSTSASDFSVEAIK
ncbi:uncharacterized protein [Rhodnius prolixus]|uniref:uncharacterized protein n=1 Tax=Rhodnius prolixus TaxID=13249 RepID=UPI003D18ADC7